MTLTARPGRNAFAALKSGVLAFSCLFIMPRAIVLLALLLGSCSAFLPTPDFSAKGRKGSKRKTNACAVGSDGVDHCTETDDRYARYNASYYAYWYHNERTRVVSPQITRSRALAAAVIDHAISGKYAESVLDLGCGEGHWYGALREILELDDLRYVGVDASQYAADSWEHPVPMFHEEMHKLPEAVVQRLLVEGKFDMIVISDVLQYLTNDEMAATLRTAKRLLNTLGSLSAYMLVPADVAVGDVSTMPPRTEAEARELFLNAGFFPVGLYTYVHAEDASRLPGGARGWLKPSELSLQPSGSHQAE
jgi:SAM-dependent methyltransferase